jgi:DsbC/DsbD-like thiol-disulfide interchange protein
MKKLVLLFLAAFSLPSFSQQKDPVSWKAEYRAAAGEVVITAFIENGWHTYSQRPTDAGPIPTSFTFAPVKGVKLIGKPEETDAHEEFVPAFDAKIFVFKGKAEFRQKVELAGKGPFTLPLKVEYMSCNDMMCLPPKTLDLTVKLQ